MSAERDGRGPSEPEAMPEVEREPAAGADETAGARLHLGIAEQGKLHAIAGDHKTALRYYRQAMHMTVQRGDSELFFRHYLECVMESLEQIGSYEEVLAYCDKAIDLYATAPPEDPMSIRDLAHIHQRKAVVLIKQGEQGDAVEPLREAVRLVREAGQTIPLAETLLRWVEGGFRLEAERVLAEQKRHRYFGVRPDNVEPDRAVALPPEMLMAG